MKTGQLHLDRNEPDLTNLVNGVYISLQPAEFSSLIWVNKCRPAAPCFLNPSDPWSCTRERRPFLQDREVPPEGKVILRGEYLFPSLTLEAGWAPQMVWAGNDDAVLRRSFGNPQRSSPAWVKVSGGLAGVDGSCLLSYDREWKAGLNLARVFGDNLEIHYEMGWEEWDREQADKLNHLSSPSPGRMFRTPPERKPACNQSDHEVASLKPWPAPTTPLPAGQA